MSQKSKPGLVKSCKRVSVFTPPVDRGTQELKILALAIVDRLM